MNQNMNMNIPNMPQGGNDNNAPTDAEGSYKRLLGGKDITFFWLMQHYSKENAAAYKAQKAAKKAKKKGGAFQPELQQAQATPLQAVQHLPYQNQQGVPTPGINQAYQEPPQGWGNVPAPAAQAMQAAGMVQTPKMETPIQASPYTAPAFQHAPVGETATPQKAYSQDAHFGDTVVLRRTDEKKEGQDITANSAQPKASLECVGYGQIVDIEEYPYSIGRDIDEVDLCIPDNDHIGRRHAELSLINGICYIIDLNSTNHVFVNGQQIEARQPTRLSDGDRFCLADEEFIIHLRS